MEILARLIFGHLLADFTFQTNYIAHWKRRSLFWLVVHVVIHPLCYIPLVWPFLGDIWVTRMGVSLNGWACVGIASILHFAEDWFRVRMVNKGWPDNTLFYMWDQAVHLTVILLLVPLGTQGMMAKWSVVGILFVIVTHFSTVTVWFIERDVYGYDREYPETSEKYISMVQRLAVWLCFFLTAPWWYAGPLCIAGLYIWLVWSKKVDFSWPSIIGGNFIALAAGFVARFWLDVHL